MAPLQAPPPAQVQADVARALAEDIGSGDVTADLLPDDPAHGYVIAKEDAVVAGRPWFDACFLALDPDWSVEWEVAEGGRIRAGQVACRFAGRVRALVSAERCALNFLQTLSGTATRTADFVAATVGTRARILDTRKTLPGRRIGRRPGRRGCVHPRRRSTPPTSQGRARGSRRRTTGGRRRRRLPWR